MLEQFNSSMAIIIIIINSIQKVNWFKLIQKYSLYLYHFFMILLSITF